VEELGIPYNPGNGNYFQLFSMGILKNGDTAAGHKSTQGNLQKFPVEQPYSFTFYGA